MPRWWQLADSASAKVVAALGAHPAIMGGATGSGAISLQAQRQFRNHAHAADGAADRGERLEGVRREDPDLVARLALRDCW